MDKTTQLILRLLITTAGKEGSYYAEQSDVNSEWLVLEKSSNPMWSSDSVLYDCIEHEAEARVIAALCNLGLDESWDQIHPLVEALID